MISDAKAIKAVDTIRRYCAERGCSIKCAFYSPLSAVCQLKVKSPDKFPEKVKRKNG